jgi:D-xylonolactonase
VKYSPVSLLRNLASLAESPVWHPAEGRLYFIDIPAGRIWRFDPSSGQAQVFHEGETIGGMTRQQGGGWLLFRKNDLAWVDANGKFERSRPIRLPETQRFNDVLADPAGRVYAGTIGHGEESGGLYGFERDGSFRCFFRGTRISNGMAFSPCERFLYWTCSTTRTIQRFRHAPETGALTERFCIYQCEPGEGIPDGLTVDLAGNLWSARWGTGLVVLLSPRGEKLAQIEFPESNITSLTWGGANLEDLYVTAARQDGKPGVHDLFVVPQAGVGKADGCSGL